MKREVKPVPRPCEQSDDLDVAEYIGALESTLARVTAERDEHQRAYCAEVSKNARMDEVLEYNVRIRKALRLVRFEGLTAYHDVPKLIPSEKLRVALVDAGKALAVEKID